MEAKKSIKPADRDYIINTTVRNLCNICLEKPSDYEEQIRHIITQAIDTAIVIQYNQHEPVYSSDPEADPCKLN